MAYDPRTGITTYREDAPLDVAASDPAPSTATTPGMLSTPRDVATAPQFLNLGWDYAGGGKQFDMPLYAYNHFGLPEQVYLDYGNPSGDDLFFMQPLGYYFASDGTPMPSTASPAFAGGQSYGDGMGWDEMAVIMGLAAITGGAFAPALSGATGLGAGASAGTIGGATAGGISSGGDPTTIGTGAALGALGGGVGSSVSNMAGGGMLGAAAGGAAGGGLSAAAGGGDIVQSALMGGLASGATRGAGELIADAYPTDVPMDVAESLKRRGMLPIQLADAGTNYLTGVGVDTGLGLSTGASAVPGAYDLPAPTVNYLTGLGVNTGFGPSTGASQVPGTTDLAPSGMLPPSQPAPEPMPLSEAELREQRAAKATSTLEKLGRFGAALAKMHEGRGTPEDAPQRAEGQSDEQYAGQLVQYANLDPQALADAGLTPGTPEYYQFVMDQMDSVIAQVTNGLDPESADLSAQLRTKTRTELDALERALFVRGQMGQLMGSGKYVDPVTGLGEDVIAPDGGMFNPAVGAYQRGLARSTGELAHSGDPRGFIRGMLLRDPDLFGMQAGADAETLAAELAAQSDDPLKRRRGMLPQYSLYS